jgi:endonuclease VIII
VRKRSQGRLTTFSLDPREQKYVYGRGRKPCRRCGTPVEFARQGRDARVTYWCPKCQAL